jgi:hypothetical protein
MNARFFGFLVINKSLPGLYTNRHCRVSDVTWPWVSCSDVPVTFVCRSQSKLSFPSHAEMLTVFYTGNNKKTKILKGLSQSKQACDS